MSERHMREAREALHFTHASYLLDAQRRQVERVAAALEAAERRGVRVGLARAQGVTAAASERLRGANRRRCSAEMDIATLAIAAIPASVDVL